MPSLYTRQRAGEVVGLALQIHHLTVGDQPRTNADRVAEAEQLVQAMRIMTGVDPADDADGPLTALGDVLAQLLHWADARGIDFDAALLTARGHHQIEVEEEISEAANFRTA